MKSFLRKVFYSVPGLASHYHWLWAFLGAIFYGFPSKKIFVIGVTGTKGKTTVLELMDAILTAAGPSTGLRAGNKTALLSSIKVKIGDHEEKNTTENTMPGRFFIQRFLRRAVRAGCTHALIEVTSEGVKYHRHRFIKWGAAFFVNLHPEHIEAHGSFEKYRAAKINFLKYAAMVGAKIFVNRDDKGAESAARMLTGRKIEFYSRRDFPDVEKLESGLYMSDFNKENVAAALALAKALGVQSDIALRAVQEFRGVPGRMEFVQKKPFSVVIDYAHTPDSLEAVYKSLKSLNPKSSILNSRMICVLGSAGGGRDKWKRPEMGRVAASYCDAIVLTNEDPYDEDPIKIIREIEAGVHENPHFDAKLSALTWRILERREAIMHALSLAREGDAVVLTGKGSESWIHEARGRRIPWNEKQIVEDTLRDLKTKE